jgi:hypothetical protein
VLTCGGDSEEILDGLRGALLTDAEVADGSDAWRHLPDPFGWYHADPCGEPAPVAPPAVIEPGVAEPGVARPGVAEPGVPRSGAAEPAPRRESPEEES